MTETDPPRPQRLATYARRGMRPLSARQQRLLDALLPRLAVPEAAPGALSPATLFPGARETWLEIGFGGGEHLIGQARRNGTVGLIGAEPFRDGIVKSLSAIEADGLETVRLLWGDGRDLVDWLATASIARAFILFPDPWPKTRHHKRRLIQPDFAGALARVIRPGGRLRIASDVAGYVDEIVAIMAGMAAFEWMAGQAGDWRLPPADHVTTRYEAKRLGDCAPVFLDYLRTGS